MIQEEIDAAAELIDFFRFNAKFAVELEGEQPLSVPPSTNSMLYRGLEVPPPGGTSGGVGGEPPEALGLASPPLLPQGFVAAISPFNFTAIGGNLAGAPALMVRCGQRTGRWQDQVIASPSTVRRPRRSPGALLLWGEAQNVEAAGRVERLLGLEADLGPHCPTLPGWPQASPCPPLRPFRHLQDRNNRKAYVTGLGRASETVL